MDITMKIILALAEFFASKMVPFVCLSALRIISFPESDDTHAIVKKGINLHVLCTV